MTYYQNEDGELCYAAGSGEPVTGVCFSIDPTGTLYEAGDGLYYAAVPQEPSVEKAFKQMANSLTELANEMWPLYLEYKRQRSRRVWRKYGSRSK